MAEIRVYDPRDLDRQDWHQMQAIARAAYTDAYTQRSSDEIDAFTDWGDPEFFYQSHRNPNESPDKYHNGSLWLVRPRVAVATHLHEPVGYAYSAHASVEVTEDDAGEEPPNVQKFFWLREVVVTPWYQRHRVAKRLSRRLLWRALPLETVCTDILPDESHFMQDTLTSVGFKPMSERAVQIYGDDSEPVRMLRMQARTAYGVIAHLY